MRTFALKTWIVIILLTGGLSFSCRKDPPAERPIYKLAELNTEQIRALDRGKTVVLLPGGILEEHGPYLPSYTDGYMNERLTDDLAKAIVQRPDWSVVVFPVIPLGSSGANDVGAKFSFPGTYAIRPETLRAVYMDLGTEFGEQGFRWIFLIHGHGAPAHNQAVDEAGEYFREIYGGRMVNLAGLDTGSDPAVEVMRANTTREALEEDGLSMHAGLLETNRTMALRPDLVPSRVLQAPSVTARELSDVFRIAVSPDWQGYFGAPRYASAELGRRIVAADSGWLVEIALEILDGKVDERQIARITAIGNIREVIKTLEPAMQRNADIGKRQRDWITKNGKR